jgi:hypothetical protein
VWLLSRGCALVAHTSGLHAGCVSAVNALTGVNVYGKIWCCSCFLVHN